MLNTFSGTELGEETKAYRIAGVTLKAFRGSIFVQAGIISVSGSETARGR